MIAHDTRETAEWAEFAKRVLARTLERVTAALKAGARTKRGGFTTLRLRDYLPEGAVPSPSDADLVEDVSARMAADLLLYMAETGGAV